MIHVFGLIRKFSVRRAHWEDYYIQYTIIALEPEHPVGN